MPGKTPRIFVEAIDFVQQIYKNRMILSELTKRDFRTRYVQNVFGLAWAIIEPLAMMVILWFVFTYLRSSRDIAYPYSLYLLTGLIAYDMFNKTINSATRSIKNFSFLITKVNFRLAVVPLVKIASELLIHFIIILIVVIILLFNGIGFSFYWFQIFYYVLCAVVLLMGVTWFTSSVLLFFPDITYITTIIMRVLFFMTPIFWTIDKFPPNYAFIIKLNPLYYLVNGYRDSFLVHKGFWEYPELTLYYWGFTLVFLIVGMIVFRKLRPQFADVI